MSTGPVDSSSQFPLNVASNNPQAEKPIGTFTWLMSGASYAVKTTLWAVAHPIVATQTTCDYLVGKKMAPLSNEDIAQALTATTQVASEVQIEPLTQVETINQLPNLEDSQELSNQELPQELSNQELPQEKSATSTEEKLPSENIQPSLLQRATNLGKKILYLPFQRVSVIGYNVNPLNYGVNAIKSYLYPTPPLPDEELVEKLQILKEKNRSLIPEILSPLTTETSRVEEHKRIQSSSEESKKLKEAKISFDNQSAMLAENIADFSAINLVDSLLIKADRATDPLSFYLACKADGNAIKGYLDILWKQNFFAWAVAKISLPFITTFVNPILKAGMNKLIIDIQKHFTSPQNSRKEIINFFKVASDYFTTLKKINSAYAELKPGDQDYTLSREDYVKKYLKNYDTQFVVENFNAFLTKEFSLRNMDPSVIPWFIPSIFYKKIDAIISDSISGLDLMNSMIDNVIGIKAHNTNLTYIIASNLRDTFKTAKQSLSNTSDTSPNADPQYPNISRVVEHKPKDYLDNDEKKIIGNFLDSFLDFLPLEGISDSKLKEALKSGIVKALQGGLLESTVSSKLKNKILEVLLDVTGQLFRYLNKDSSGYSLFAEQLQNMNEMFSPQYLTAPIRNRQECQQVIEEAKTVLQEVIDLTIEDAFKVSPLEVESKTIEEQTKTILQNHTTTTTKFSQLVDIFQAKKKQISNSSDIDFVEDKVDQLLININDLTNIMLEDLNDTLQFSSLDKKLRDDIKRVTASQIENLSEIVSHLAEVKKNLELIKRNQDAVATIDDLIQKVTTPITDPNVPGITEKDFESKLHKINDSELNDEGQQLLLDIDQDRAFLSELNQEIRVRDQIQSYLIEANQTFEEIAFFNAKIMSRPQDSEISLLKNQLIEIERLSAVRGKLETKDEIKANLDQSLRLIAQIKESLLLFSNTLSESEKKVFEQALNDLEQTEQLVQSRFNQDISSNLETVAIKASLVDQRRKNYTTLSDAIKQINSALDTCPEKNKLDQKAISSRIDNLNNLQIKNSRLITSEHSIDINDITIALNYVQGQLLSLSLSNENLDKNMRKIIEPKKIIEQIKKSSDENFVESLKKIQIKIQKEGELLDKLKQLAVFKKGNRYYLSQSINESFDSIQALASKNKDAVNTLKIEKGFEFNLGLSAPASYLGKREVKKLLESLPTAIIDFALDPLHREELTIRGPLTQMAKIKVN